MENPSVRFKISPAPTLIPVTEDFGATRPDTVAVAIEVIMTLI